MMSSDHDTEKMYTTDEVARICRVRPITVREWIREKKIDAVRPGKAYLIPHSALKSFLQERHG